MSENNENQRKVGFFSIMKSALSALIGVQKDANRIRDFESGKFWHFFLAGFIVVALFMLTMWLWVQAMLKSAA